MSGTSSNTRYGKNGKDRGKRGKAFAETQFVEIFLTEADKAALHEFHTTSNEDPWDWLVGWLAEGYKLSVTPDPTHGCVIATLTGRDESSPNFGCTLSARGPGLTGALAALHYKVTVICANGCWMDYAPKQQPPGADFG